MAGRVRAVESALLAISANPQAVQEALYPNRRRHQRQALPLPELHVCKWCGGPHAGCECRTRRDQGAGPMRNENPHHSGGGAVPPY